MSMESINPATGQKIKTYEEHSEKDVKLIIEDVQKSFVQWRDVSFSERSRLMKKASDVLKASKNKFAQLMCEEMGKPLKQGVAEIEKCAWVCEFYAEHAESFLSNEAIESDASKSFVSFQPIGIVLAVMPWNFPFWQVFRFLAPALMAGNAGILKHASNVCGCALAIEEVIKKAGFPENIFRTLLIGSKKVGKVIENPYVRAVTLTGSTPAGKAVAQKAGSVLKKTVLELGGSDPYIVLEDADLDKTVESCVTSRLINSGQSCVAAKRFIIVESLKDEFEKKYVELMKQKKMGDPTDKETDIGPLARHDLRDDLHVQVKKSIDQGAKLLLGGEIPNNKGAFYPPTVLSDVKNGMLAYEEELFGPVATIISAKDQNEAMRIANDSVFGLGGAIFTKDVEKGERLASKELDAGCCFVNSFVKSDPRLPFGGVKESGYGRELSSFGIREFVNIKTVYLA